MRLDRRAFLSTTGALAAGGLGRGVWAVPPVTAPAVDLGTPTGVNPFAADLYGQLRSEKGNVFVSPFSVSTALAMTAGGAQGATLTQMAKTLRFQGTEAAPVPHQSFAALLASVNGRPGEKRGFDLSVANGLWAQNGYPWRDESKKLVTESYSAAIKDVDFAGAAEPARRAINRWVEQQTNDKIKESFSPGLIDDKTRLVLVNAIYFKGKWEFAFEKRLTTDAEFTLADGKKQNVPLMFRKARLNLSETDEFQLLELPYQGEQTSMLILLPRKTDGLPALEEKLSATAWDQWTAAVKPAGEVHVYLPRFKAATQYLLNDPLKSLGMVEAFDVKKADCGGMVSSKPEGPLFISAVVHKAFCDVNEEGTEAAAATGVVVETNPFGRGPLFRADHPFLFAIRHNPTKAILFMGRVSNPTG